MNDCACRSTLTARANARFTEHEGVDWDAVQKAYEEIKGRRLSGDEALNFVKDFQKSAHRPPRKVLKIMYRTEAELMMALEARLNDLKQKVATTG